MDNINQEIEKAVEKKFNEILDKIPITTDKTLTAKEIDYFNFNIYDLYKNTLQTVIDIINEIVALLDEKKYIANDIFYEKLYRIFYNNNRLFYIGIILIILSFVIYFIDGASI